MSVGRFEEGGVHISASAYFSSHYVEAREKFLAACDDLSIAVDSRLNPRAIGARGEALYMDIARIGRADASRTLILTSATHGVEGYCGSGAQVGFLRSGFLSDLPEHVNVVLVHAMNPYGFSHDRRVNEDNVDLNRNFLDFTAAGRPDSRYAEIHPYILPDDWDGPARTFANKQLALFIEKHGMKAFQAAVSGGQYQHEDGIFFGGQRATWSNQTFRAVLADYAGFAECVACIDFHTGLGPYGYGELISLGSLDQKSLVRDWFGDEATDPDAGTSSSAPVVGTVAHGIADALPDADIAFVALEYGTRDISTVLGALRADNWLYLKGDLESDLGKRIKAEIRDALYPDQDDWKSMVWTRACEVARVMIDGLSRRR